MPNLNSAINKSLKSRFSLVLIVYNLTIRYSTLEKINRENAFDKNKKKSGLKLNTIAQGPVLRKMVKFNPGLSQILSKVFLSKNMSLELAK